MEWTTIITTLIGGLLGGGGLSAILNWRNIKKKGSAEADSAAIDALNNAINTMSQIDEGKDKEITDLKQELRDKQTQIDNLNEQLTQKRCENTTKGYYMCVHQGCNLRRPTMGRGKEYYAKHNGETDFGCDYLSIEELIEQYKNKRNE